MTDPKPVAPPEKSLSYIAWSLKEISANLAKIVAMQEQFLEIARKEARGEIAVQTYAPKTAETDLPF